jgi:DNA repair ATPase RecN
MEGPLKELAKLEKLTSKSCKGKAAFIDDSLVSLLQSLRDAKGRLEAGVEIEGTLVQLAQTVDIRKKDVDDKQKEVYSSLSRLGKALDKVCNLAFSSWYGDFWHLTEIRIILANV